VVWGPNGRLIRAVAPAHLGPRFRWLLASSWVSNLGDGIALAAAPLLIAGQTRDPRLIALAALAQRVPWLVFGLHAGVLADRLDRRRVIIIGNMIRVAVLAGLVGVIVAEAVDVTVVLAALFLLGSAEVFVDVTSGTLLPMIVEPNDLGIANSRLIFGIMTLNQLAGPALGAALFAIGAALPFATQAAAMALAALLIGRMSVTRRPIESAGATEDAERRIRSDIADGARWLWGHAQMRTLAVAVITFNVTFGAGMSVLVLLAIERLGLGDIGFGLLTSASAAGGALGSVLYARTERAIGAAQIMRYGLVIEAGLHLVFAMTTVAWVAMAAFFVFGIHASMWGTTATSVRQRAVPEHLQGRVGSVYLVGVQGGMAVGAAVGGSIAAIWSVRATYWFAFVGSVVILVLIWGELGKIAEPIETDDGDGFSLAAG
jgi:MFS family permease